MSSTEDTIVKLELAIQEIKIHYKQLKDNEDLKLKVIEDMKAELRQSVVNDLRIELRNVVIDELRKDMRDDVIKDIKSYYSNTKIETSKSLFDYLVLKLVLWNQRFRFCIDASKQLVKLVFVSPFLDFSIMKLIIDNLRDHIGAYYKDRVDVIVTSANLTDHHYTSDKSNSYVNHDSLSEEAMTIDEFNAKFLPSTNSFSSYTLSCNSTSSPPPATGALSSQRSKLCPNGCGQFVKGPFKARSKYSTNFYKCPRCRNVATYDSVA